MCRSVQPQKDSPLLSGWTDLHTFLVYSWLPDGGPGNLRTFNIDTGKSISVWPGSLFPDGASGPGIFAWDALSATALIPVKHLNASTRFQEGIYLADLHGGGAQQISDAESQGYPVWMPELGAFFLETSEGIIRILPSGEVVAGALPDLGRYVRMPIRSLVWAPDGMWWAWGGTAGLWIGSTADNAPVQVSDQVVQYATWSPDGQNVLFFTRNSLYIVGRTGEPPRLLANGLSFKSDNSAEWVQPAQH